MICWKRRGEGFMFIFAGTKKLKVILRGEIPTDHIVFCFELFMLWTTRYSI